MGDQKLGWLLQAWLFGYACGMVAVMSVWMFMGWFRNGRNMKGADHGEAEKGRNEWIA